MKQRRCSNCGSQDLRRVNRSGVWQRQILTFFGFYPWECVFCRERQLLRDEGKKRRNGPAGSTA